MNLNQKQLENALEMFDYLDNSLEYSYIKIYGNKLQACGSYQFEFPFYSKYMSYGTLKRKVKRRNNKLLNVSKKPKNKLILLR